MARHTTFCASWRNEVVKNVDGIDEKYDWVTREGELRAPENKGGREEEGTPQGGQHN